MRAHEVIYNGIKFRSKLECKWYIMMTETFGWRVEYEPEIEGINNYIPDFLVKGCKRNIIVEVKPIRSLEEWQEHPDLTKVKNSGLKKNNEHKSRA